MPPPKDSHISGASHGPTTGGYGTPRRAAFGGAREAIGVPALILASTYVGFGSLVRESGLSLWHGLFSTLTGWAAPGQVALAELYAIGAALPVIAMAVALTNARLLPMTVALMPHLRAPGTAQWKYYLFAHYIAVTGWAQAMRVCPTIPPPQRLPYFVGFALVIWMASIAATGLGFYLASVLPATISLGLVFLNPIYFMLVFAADLKQRARVLALMLGAVAGPSFYLLVPDWDLLVTGLAAGTLAFAADRLLRRGGARGRS